MCGILGGAEEEQEEEQMPYCILCRILGGAVEEEQEQMPFQAFNGREQMPVREILTGTD